MARRTSPFGSYRGITQQVLTGSLEQKARSHETNRHNEAKKILFHLFLMTRFELVRAADVISFSAAIRQHITATDGNQAAHCLPCQILVNNAPLQSRLENVSDTFFTEVETAFSTTDVLPANYNKADSLAESHGLKRAFSTACTEAVRTASVFKFKRVSVIMPQFAATFQTYRTAAASSFQDSMIHLRGQTPLAPTPAKRQEREERLVILQQYLDRLRSADASLNDIMFFYPDDLYDEYRRVTGKD